MRIRRKYKLPPVDMTPFVSIALLLLVFFVWVKMVQKPNVLSAKDYQGCRKGIEPAYSNNVLTIVLLDQDTIQFCYHSSGSTCFAYFVTTHRYSLQLRQELSKHRKETLTPGQLAIVIVPMAKSTIGILINVLNELRIAGNLPYILSY